MIDPETQTENAPFTHADDILICEEHQLVQRFETGQTWGDVGAAITEHSREAHADAD